MTVPYTNLDRVRNYLSLASGNTSDDDQLLEFSKRASRSIDKYTRRRFYPRVETRFYNHPDNEQRLMLDDDLLSLTTLKTVNGACTLSSSILFLGTGDTWNRPPYDRIELKSDGGSLLYFSGTPQRANEVTGIWGYHEDYGNAWVDTGTSLAASYTASGGSMSIAGGSAGAGASDAEGVAPRIAIGDLLKVGDEHFMVTAAGSAQTIFNVQPYQNGTTAASHPSGTSVAKFAYEPDIEWATRRLTGWLYGQRDTPFANKTAFVQLGVLEIPVNLAGDVREKLERFKRTTFRVVP